MHRGIHSSTNCAVPRRLAACATQHAFDHDVSGLTPIGDLLPKLRLRVRTILSLVWRDGAWRVEWVVQSYPELIHVTSRAVTASSANAGRCA